MVTRSSLCLFLFVGSLIQVNEATPTPIVIAQYIPKFFSLNIEIYKAVRNGTNQITDAQNRIKALVDSADSAVDKQLSNLSKLVEESKANANQIGINITSCINEEEHDIYNINRNVLMECRLLDALKRQNMFAFKLAKEEVFLSIIVKWCIIKHPIQGDKLRVCFDDKIKDVEDKIEAFQNEVGTTVPEAIQYSTSCTEKYLGALNGSIDKIYRNFRNCTDVISPIIRIK